MDIAKISAAVGVADVGHTWASQAQNAASATARALQGSATGLAAGALAATAGVALQTQPMAYRQALQHAVDSVINHFTKNGVTNLSALSANAANAQSVAKHADQVLEAKLNDPTVSLQTKQGMVAQAQEIHLNADIATAAANKAGQLRESASGSKEAQFDKEVDGVIARFSQGQPLTIDTVKAVYDNGVKVHANATQIITDGTKVLNDPNASPQEKSAAVGMMKRASHADDVAVAAVGKAQKTYMAENNVEEEEAA